jgi:hypothetical protein
LALGTFLGIGALAVVYLTPILAGRWTFFRGIAG